jgi:hypothetical protein
VPREPEEEEGEEEGPAEAASTQLSSWKMMTGVARVQAVLAR